MQDVATQAYTTCPVGGTAWMRPDPDNGIGLEAFQSVEIAANILQQDGLITIQEKHRESQTGQHLIDAIKFVRLR